MTAFFIATILLLTAAALFLMPGRVSAHCDTMDGPTAIDGKKALETGNINHAYQWITPAYEQELLGIFELSRNVRALGADAQELADRYFLENLVRIHRAGEGASYDGLLPAGTPIDEKVAAADKSIEIGNLSPLEGLVPDDAKHELEHRSHKAIALKSYDVNDVASAREYVEAYVSFFKLAEGEEHDHGGHGHNH